MNNFVGIVAVIGVLPALPFILLNVLICKITGINLWRQFTRNREGFGGLGAFIGVLFILGLLTIIATIVVIVRLI